MDWGGDHIQVKMDRRKYIFKSAIRGFLLLTLAIACLVPSHPGYAQGEDGTNPAQSTSVFLPAISNWCGSCYYVDSIGGSDTNPGTSIKKPWKSLAHVHATDFPPGSIINFKRGSSWNEELFIDTPGVNGKPVTFTAYGDGEPPIFSNSGHGLTWATAIFIQADWVIVEGLLVRDAQDVGVYIANGSDHNLVRDNEVTGVGQGIAVHGQYNLITRNTIHDLRMVKNTPGGIDDYGATGVVLDNSNNEVSYNRMIRCIAASYDFGVDGGAVEWYGNASNNYVHHNWASENAGFLEVGVGSVQEARVAYNVSINNGRFSLINLTGNFASYVTNFRVENNTLIEQVEGERGWVVFGFEGNPAANTFLTRNNIIYAENLQAISNKTTFSHDHNLYFLNNVTALGFNLGTGEQIADPKFVDLGNYDLHLNSSSPAIDAGIDLGFLFDFDNRPVPVNILPDLGAYEYRAIP